MLPKPLAIAHILKADTPIFRAGTGQFELTEPKQSQPEDKNKLPSDDNEKWVRFGTYVNGVIAVATLAIAIFSIVQARAAKLNAQAVIDSERAWLMLRPLDPKGKDFWPIVRKNAVSANPEPTQVVVRFRNYGRTPAWLIESAFKLVKSEMDESRFPFDYQEPVALPDGEPIRTNGTATSVVVQLEANPPYLTVDDMVSIKENRTFLYLYGFLRYRDVFSEQRKELRETYFSFRYRSSPQAPGEAGSGMWCYCGTEGRNKHA
jgi:hypothetical protein